MKKAIVIMLTGAMMLAAVACGGGSNSTPAQETKTEEAKPAEETQETVESTVVEPEQAEPNITEDAMSFEDYMAAATDTEVIVEGAIQGKQSFFSRDDQGLATIYLQDEKGGAYFIYELPCTEKEYELMEIGKIIKVKGYKSEWSGEIEVVDVETWMFVDGEYIAEAEDVTALLGTDDLAAKMNKKVLFKGMKVEPIKDKDNNDVAFIYNYDGSDSDDTANVTIQVRSSDGLIGDSIRCKVLKKALGMKFYYTTAGDLRTQIFHPEALAFYVHVSGSVLGSVTYKPSGTWFASETRETTVIISNARSEASASTRVQPLGRLARIDNYRYLNGYERTSEGFAEYFQEVWNLTGWDSYTALNGSNGYYKHAHPTALYLNIVLSYTSLDPLHFYPEEGARIPVYYDHVLPRVVYPGTTSEYVAGAGTDWLFLWRQYDREGGDYMDMVFNLSTYIVGSSGFEHGRLYEEGSD